ncbi:hypothetical protein D7319_15830 [Streptomyces radicis]|nr:hypothetical protein D7319_15830 [Streptomyces radicis]
MLAIGVVVLGYRDLPPWTPSGFETYLLPSIALAYLVIGALRHELDGPRVVAVETAGVVLFGGITALALAVDPAVGQYLVAAGLAGHALWDLAHLRTGRVVPHAFAEFCVVFDLLVAAALIAAAV